MSTSRAHHFTLNMASGILYQVLVLILNFVSRIIFIRTLGVELLGINGLFSNILSVLALAELGMGNAFVYSMYKPLAAQDTARLTALLNYFRKLYYGIAAVVTVLGLAMIPFLKYFIHLEQPVPHTTIYYLLILFNVVASYLFVCRTSIVIADQKAYKLKIYNMVFVVFRFILQIIVLLTLQSFLLYLLVQIACVLAINIMSVRKTVQLYPFINGRDQLDKGSKREIWNTIRSFFWYQIGGVILNNTDNILISILLGTIWVGYYSNYSLIITQIVGFIGIIFTAFQAAIGSINVEANPERQYFMFRVINLVSFWLHGFCTICLVLLLNDFIALWVGSSLAMDAWTVYMAVAVFYIQGMLQPIGAFRQSSDLFKDTKAVMLYASIINLALSVWWGMAFGLAGILAATAAARLATNIWYEPYKLYQRFFKRPAASYLLGELGHAAVLIGVGTLTFLAVQGIHLSNPYLNFGSRLLVCAVAVNTGFYLSFRKTEEFKYVLGRAVNLVVKKAGKAA
ncbi:lipopolysaccharide biosynthesis protein [Paenibacillus pinistramenti]|uniref:lipopolysaccharide biosynthesis protein n=1 Tax=Paenibacillus pinistramenti TaxID=1768003 RepID=UPI001109D2B3|nr:transporter [Paenibacillus pinistramenti]